MPVAFAQNYCCNSQYNNSCCYENDFSGLYIGGNVGVITHVAYRADLDNFFDSGFTGWTSTDSNVTAGVQLGYDWQCHYSLLGLVVDWAWANNDRHLRAFPSTVDGEFCRHNFEWFTTIRGRAGITVCDALLYITGGAVVSRFEGTFRNGTPTECNHHRTRWGWVGGVGAEFLVWCNFSLGAEFLGMHFSDHRDTFTTTEGTFHFNHGETVFVGRVLLNYRFGDLCSWFR